MQIEYQTKQLTQNCEDDQLKDLIKNYEQYDGEKLVELLVQVLARLVRLRIPLQFQKSNFPKPVFLVVGEIGNGKSTLLNMVSYILTKEKKAFETSSGAKSCTKIVSKKEIGNLILIDSPGENDPDIPNHIIQQQINEQLKATIKVEGISTIITCIKAVPRIQESQLRGISKALLTYTVTYYDFDISKCPRFPVIFTMLSVHPKKKMKNTHEFLDDDSDDDDEQQQAEFNKNFLENIQVFKKYLVDITFEELGGKVEKTLLQKRIEILFPRENFYAYDLKDTDNFEREQEQVKKLIQDTFDHGNYSIQGEQEGIFEPVQIESNVRDEIRAHLKTMVDLSIDKLKDSQRIYQQSVITNEPSEKIDNCILNFSRIQQQMYELNEQCPWSLSKVPQELIKFLEHSIKKFGSISSQIAVEEIGRHNKELAKKQKQEMDAMQSKFQKMEVEMKKQEEKRFQMQKQYMEDLQKSKDELAKQSQQYQSKLEQLMQEQQRANEKHQEQMQEIVSQRAREQTKMEMQLERLEEKREEQQQEIERLKNQEDDSSGGGCTLI